MKTMLDLDANAAKKFLTNENYVTGGLSPYLQFSDIIKQAKIIK